VKADVNPKPIAQGIEKGSVLLAVENVSLSFGGVRAIRDVSFDIRKGEIRAIIGPNGAGKTSMLNCINGFYHPQEGTITYKGQKRHDMRPYLAARGGIARTFQNVALFKGMSTRRDGRSRCGAACSPMRSTMDPPGRRRYATAKPWSA
jgi:branched-chain amino acid transport system ATP-binding protein